MVKFSSEGIFKLEMMIAVSFSSTTLLEGLKIFPRLEREILQ